MSPPDRATGSTPARLPEPVDRLPTSSPAPPPAGPGAPAAGPPPGRRRGSSARLVARGLRRHWWQALLVWAAGSAGLIALARDRVRPTYEASSAIRVDPGDRGPSLGSRSNVEFEVFREAQARRVTHPDVIASALAGHPELLRLPRLASSRDPEAEARRALEVAAVPGPT